MGNYVHTKPTTNSIRVDGPPVEIRKMVVTFDNGEKWDAINKRHRFDDNSRALIVDLPGDRRRDIRDIDIDYFSVSQRETRARFGCTPGN